MKKIKVLLIATALFVSFAGYSQNQLVSSKTHIKFFSSTAVEDFEAKNTAAVSTLKTASGDVVFSVPMQGFEFEKALMQKHFNNNKYLDTKKFPKAKLKAKITNLSEIDFAKDGIYDAIVEGDLTIKGVTKNIKEKGKVTVKGKAVEVQSKFNITLADYGITFVKGKPSKSIAKTIEVTVFAEYKHK